MAKAHLAFAETELEQGAPGRAEEHYRIAEPNARAAFTLSPAERCAPRQIEVRPPVDGDQDGDGVPDSTDECVSEPEDVDDFEDADGCPDADNDSDGIPDDADGCALEAEDRDGYEDTDGCPDADNDGDGVPDASDGCPNEAGPPSENGCPQRYEDVEITATTIRIHQQVYFDVGRASIREVSFTVLNTVAQVLADHPTVQIEVGGHTDSRGRDSSNLRLSQARADAVLEHLVGRGIDRSRLRARGYGETRPIESNNTESGRAANRRVEFVRTDSEGAQSP